MTWADAAPNLLIGLREGLEAGLVVSILLAALRKAGAGPGGAAAGLDRAGVARRARRGDGLRGLRRRAHVLDRACSPPARSRRSAAPQRAGRRPGHRDGVLDAADRGDALGAPARRGAARRDLGAGALTFTAFLAVGREGLETTLFMWTAVKASGSTISPLVGAGLGLAAAVVAVLAALPARGTDQHRRVLQPDRDRCSS